MVSEAWLDENGKWRCGSSKMWTACWSSRCIDVFSIFGTNWKRVKKMYKWASSVYARKELQQNLPKCRRPWKDYLTVLWVVFNNDGYTEPDTKTMDRVLDTPAIAKSTYIEYGRNFECIRVLQLVSVTSRNLYVNFSRTLALASKEKVADLATAGLNRSLGC